MEQLLNYLFGDSMRRIIFIIAIFFSLYETSISSSGMGPGPGIGPFISVPSYSFYSTMDSLASISSPVIGTGGTTTGDETYTAGVTDTAFTKNSASTSGFSIPSSNINTSNFTLEFDFIPSDNNNSSNFSGLLTFINVSFGTYTSMILYGGNGGGANWEWGLEIYDDDLNHHTLQTGFLSELQFASEVPIHIKIILDKVSGTITIWHDSLSYNYNYGDSFNMHSQWGRDASSQFSFFKDGTHTSKIDNLKVY